MWLLLLAQLAQPAKPPARPPRAPTTKPAEPAPAPKPAEPAPAPSASDPASKPSAGDGPKGWGGSPPPKEPAPGAASATPLTLADPKDPRTGSTTIAEGTGLLPIDPRTTRDEQFDPRASAQAEEERREVAARIQRAQQRSASRGGRGARLLDPEGRPVQHRPTEITTFASLVAGYNSNVVVSPATPGGAPIDPGAPLKSSPAAYTALEGRVDLDFWGKGEEPQQLSFQMLGQQYNKLYSGEPDLPPDGSVLGLYGGGFRLGNSTRLAIRAFSSVQTLNGARQQDGAVFQPNLGDTQRTFTLSNLTFQLLQEISPTLQYVHVVGASVSTTLRDQPTPLQDSAGREFNLFHRGLDFVQVNTSGTVLKEVGQHARVFADVEYEGLYNNFFLDFTRNVPVRRGDFSVHVGRVNAGATYFASEALSLTGRGGVAVGTPAPISVPTPPPAPGAPVDPNALDANDRSLIVSPVGGAEVLYQKPTFQAQLNAAYTFGTLNPRLGYGRTVSVDALVGGVPFPSDRTLRNVALLVVGTATRAVLRPDNTGEGFLTFVSVSALVRYRLTNWLGALGGYSNRYVNSSGTLGAPDLVRHQVFFGLSGFFTTDVTEPPPLSVFAPPRPTG
jgi:hypothetical protein